MSGCGKPPSVLWILGGGWTGMARKPICKWVALNFFWEREMLQGDEVMCLHLCPLAKLGYTWKSVSFKAKLPRGSGACMVLLKTCYCSIKTS
jgi:hypothetical protein